MPLINIRSMKTSKDLDIIISKLINIISEKTVFPKERVNISWEFYESGYCYSKGTKVTDFTASNHELIIQVTISERNKKSDIDQLIQELVKGLSYMLNIETEQISAIINIVDRGCLYINNKFI